MTADYDLAIIGSGFGGSILAMIARRLGLRVLLLERGTHPRFAIGESASPLAGILIEQLSDRYDLPRLRPLSAYGTWQRTYPHIGCGLKRGFTYFRHEEGQPYRVDADRANQLLVAASPDDEVADTHWLRSDVDAFLMCEALALGADYIDRVELDRVEWRPGGSAVLSGGRRGRAVRVSAALVVDASGPHGFLSRVLGIGNRGFADYPHTQALFSHFTGVARCDEMPDYVCVEGGPEGPPLLQDERESSVRRGGPSGPPYSMDDAALHHVFDGGWMWVLRFGHGVTSAGVAVTDALAADLKLADGAPAWSRLLARYPSIAAQFADAEPIREYTWMPRLAWRAETSAGDGWAMLPSAAAFVDPLFSTGIPLTLRGIERLARILEGEAPLGVGSRKLVVSGPRWDDYSRITLGEADATADFIAGCYAAFPRFEDFAAYSMFYFTAASFSEISRRDGVNASAGRFLCADHPTFGDALRRLSPARTSMRGRRYADAVATAVAPLNVVGLCDPEKRNWYSAMPAPHGTNRMPA